MDLKIRGLRVVVTAGASGIGLATARAFVAEGAQVVICDVDTKALAAVAASDPALTQQVGVYNALTDSMSGGIGR